MRFAVLLAMLLACKKHEDPAAQPPPIPQKPAVEINVDAARLGALPMADRAGGDVTLGGALHDVTVVSFWASWCQPCLEEMPQLDKLAHANADPHVGYVAVNLDDADDRAAALKVLDDKHITMPVLFDPDAAAYQLLFPEAGEDMVSVPALAIVKGSRVTWRDDGYVTDEDAFAAELHEHIAAALR